MTAETAPLFDVEPRPADPVGDAIREIVPQASREQVGKLTDLVAREVERIVGPKAMAGKLR